MTNKPAISIIAPPGRRAEYIELAQEAERRGFPALYCPTGVDMDCMALCQAIAQATREIHIVSAIQPIYFRLAAELARGASFIHEISSGRFTLGLGVSHGVVHRMHGVKAGSPLGDMRRYVEELKAAKDVVGPLPPIVLAALRDKMLELATEVAGGAIWANGCRSYVAEQIAKHPGTGREGFMLADMVLTAIDEDEQAAGAVLRRQLSAYVRLPNYRAYWKAAGYGEEMQAIEAAIARGEIERLPALMSDKWLNDNTLFGSASKVREGVEAWREVGVTPVLAPSSTHGDQARALREVFDAFD